MKNRFSIFIFFILSSVFVFSQIINPSLLKDTWSASWITVPNTSTNGYGVYLFRKSISLENKPASFIIHVSADTRYKLFINEKIVSLGPARGDLFYWNYETVDIAPYLSQGKNMVAAIGLTCFSIQICTTTIAQLFVFYKNSIVLHLSTL